MIGYSKFPNRHTVSILIVLTLLLNNDSVISDILPVLEAAQNLDELPQFSERLLQKPYKNCPDGSFHHPYTDTCVYCECYCDPDVKTDFCTNNCGISPSKCNRQDQYFNSTCMPCADICRLGLNLSVCKQFCPDSRCCKTTEFYNPHNGSCLECSSVCEPAQDNNEGSAEYCCNNCPAYSKSCHDTVSPTSLVNYVSSQQRDDISSIDLTTKFQGTSNSISDSKTVVIIPVIALIIVIVIVASCIAYKKWLRKKKERTDEARNAELQLLQRPPGAGIIDPLNIQGQGGEIPALLSVQLRHPVPETTAAETIPKSTLGNSITSQDISLREDGDSTSTSTSITPQVG